MSNGEVTKKTMRLHAPTVIRFFPTELLLEENRGALTQKYLSVSEGGFSN